MPEYTDAPAGSTYESAAEIAVVPDDLSRPYYQGGLPVPSLNRGARVMCIYPAHTRSPSPPPAPASYSPIR